MIKHSSGKGVTIELPKDIWKMAIVIGYINTHKLTNISIVDRDSETSPEHSDTNVYNIGFLNKIKYPEKIVELDLYCNCEDYSPINRFVNLEQFYVYVKDDKVIDLAKFGKLKKLGARRLAPFYNLDKSPLVWLNYGHGDKKINCEIQLVQQLKNLEDLRFFTVKKFDLQQLAGLKKLKSLTFMQCDVDTVCNIEQIPSLEVVSISYCYKFAQVDGVEQLPKLRVLELDTCARLKHASASGSIKNLKMLILENVKLQDYSFLEDMACKDTFACLMMKNCGSIPSIKFLNNYPNLQAFCGWDTNVVDGDITPCLRLESASITNKRHYNLKDKQLPFGRAFFSWWD